VALARLHSRKADLGSCRLLGGDAELALLPLLEYPNEGTRPMVRVLLVQRPSEERRWRGGQFVFVVPDSDLIVVFTGWNDNELERQACR